MRLARAGLAAQTHRVRSSLGIAVAVVAAVAARPGPAAGGACPEPHLATVPRDGATAVPTNVQPRVVFEAATVEVVELVDRATRQIAKSGAASAADAEIRLRDSTGGIVAAELRRIATRHPVFVVRPTAELAANRDYDIIVHTAADDYAVARFTTGDAPDRVEPGFDGVGAARLHAWTPSKPAHWKDVLGSYAEVAVTGLDGAAGFELHALGEHADATDATLVALVLSTRGGKLEFGSLSSCVTADVEIPGRPKRGQPHDWHLWVRTFDAAGNASPLRELTFDLRRRKRAR